jgi:hypothetical protein
MAVQPRKPAEKDREEDFRDYEQRDIDEGWAYADGDAKSRRNAEYGEVSDELDPDNFEIAADTAIESSGGPSLFPKEEGGTIEDDAIEEAIADKLSESDRWSDNQIELSVDDGVVTIEGVVETESERQLINQLVLRTAGVKKTVNNLELIGVDSHIPDDADD